MKTRKPTTWEGTVVPDVPGDNKPTSYLKEETVSMMYAQREQEQGGHRKFARVNAKEHDDKKALQNDNAPEEAADNGMLQHPELDSQRFDGIDPEVSPDPPLNSEARREFDNERREQEKEKQLRLGNMPKFTSAPKPRVQ